jgi:hypothetical protein
MEENLTLMRKGKVWDIYWNEDTSKWEIRSDSFEMTYIFGVKKRMFDTWTELEKKYKLFSRK